MTDVICIGKILRDIIIRTKDSKVLDVDARQYLGFPYKEKIGVDEIFFSAGGGAANTAAALAKLGKNVSVVAAVGQDPEGEEIVNALRMKFVKTEMIQKVTKQTGISIILTSGNVNDKDYTVLIYRGANEALGKDYALDFEKLNDSRAWYVSSLGIADLDFFRKMMSYKKDNVRVAFNPGVLQIGKGLGALKEFLPKVDVLLLNKKEATELTGETEGKAFLELKRSGVKMVAITDGKNGAKIYDGEKIYFGQAYPARTKEALGAGDAFGATFFGVWLEEGNIEKALEYALVNSAAALEQYGASEGILDVAGIESRLKQKPAEIIIKDL